MRRRINYSFNNINSIYSLSKYYVPIYKTLWKNEEAAKDKIIKSVWLGLVS
jgi:hypothetical protein